MRGSVQSRAPWGKVTITGFLNRYSLSNLSGFKSATDTLSMLHLSLPNFSTVALSARLHPPLGSSGSDEDDIGSLLKFPDPSPLKPKSLRTMTGPTAAMTTRMAVLTSVAGVIHDDTDDVTDDPSLPLRLA
eukprot:GHVL01032813.1.p2 GENE.GHVL01032813.1~~GHVL01032813.1.p2  ORF type:complete len:131 (+),score=6.70 GHVL01032813.1:385-777(+)